ncbi:PAS domain-containing hybrid sensor histidine kinase/response regulator [Methylobacterium frigidaeris]|uniref:histidine kinase n=1 Tax=Methylobacterium frigidaeris TaxID=2038277 RepID=A0AA37HBP3_9HYPH|nr:PAS domain-containing hybrid sensor histidine kinase/response regulator [Methylobacterium frigidaeris]PIK69183.1 hybrid sensor histidine kinase/response regulator [Methylobacterium frigidaeris]GJD62556.1 Sensor histidine kinase RcsC [Methylobacterium frigidaeris]
MIAGWTVVLAALVYICALFAVAHWGDVAGRTLMRDARVRPTIYALSLAVYCTSWTFFGSVGLASHAGLDFLTIYVGPVLVVGFGYRLVARVVRIAKAQNSTSIADFIAARYGKSERIAALVCLIAVVGAVPYIALQLRAVAASLQVFLHATDGVGAPADMLGDLGLFVALVLAGFAVAFGTRHADATEHQDGLTLAVALESLVKLLAFLTVGGFVVGWMLGDLPEASSAVHGLGTLVGQTSGPATLIVQTLLSAAAVLLLPRQFHMAVVENRAVADVGRAAWTFPLYLVLINLFVVPLALAGLALFPEGSVQRDMTVLALPLHERADGIALVAFIGGLSAATAMVIVESVAVAIMISNHLVIPVALRRRNLVAGAAPSPEPGAPDLGGYVLVVRRAAIVAVVLVAYAYSRVAGEVALASIGLLSFAAVAQIGPAFVGALYWGRGTGLGAAAGLLVGFAVWLYTLLLPSLVTGDGWAATLIAEGPFGIAALSPTALMGVDDFPRLVHGTLWSLGLNTLAYIAGSLLRPPTAIERLQAEAFGQVSGLDEAGPVAPTFRLFRSAVTLAELRATVARFLGEERAVRAFEDFAQAQGRGPVRDEAIAGLPELRHAEHLLASAIGASSARLALSLLLRRRNVSPRAALKLLDDASAAFQYSRDILQHGLDHAKQGITVFDRDMKLIVWNRAFADLYDLPPDMIQTGIGLEAIVRFNAGRGAYGARDADTLVRERIAAFRLEAGPQRLRLHPSGRVIEIRANLLPNGGVVATYTDVTDSVAAEEARTRLNEELETRVRERTEELTRLNAALTRAKAEAEEANASKTRFLAAASHDILQPLNAARLYASALVERDRGTDPTLAENVDASLDAVEEILTALLEISRLDTGALKPQLSIVRVSELFRQVQREFGPMAQEKGLSLTVMPSSLAVRSDRQLLRRLLHNLVSNAIKYTPEGRVLVGARRRGDRVVLMVLDTGLGIPAAQQKLVFREFQRLDQGARVARGLGLGLSIVERTARLLDHPLSLASTPGRGSAFSVAVPGAPLRPVVEALGEAPRPATVPLAGLTVLAVDNEPAIVDGMRVLVGSWGCALHTAGSLSEALALVLGGSLRPDVIVADYHLDQGTGLDLIAGLRAALAADIPAVLLTADRSPDVRDAAGAQRVQVLSKPLKPAALRALLTQWRNQRAAAE